MRPFAPPKTCVWKGSAALLACAPICVEFFQEVCLPPSGWVFRARSPRRNPPAITASPDTPQIVTLGTNLTLTGAASGTPSPYFQWRFNGSEISGATNAVLTVNNFQTVNAGTYSLVASNYAGAASAAAIITLNVSNDPPRVSIVSPGSNGVFNAGSHIAVSASASDFTDGPVDHVEVHP